MGMRLAGLSRRRAYAIGLVTTITVELLQLAIPGRDTSLGDVITNSSGALIGIFCADIWRTLLFPPRRITLRLTWGWTFLWALVLTASAGLAHISLPNTTAWGVWSPALLHHDVFHGTILSATAAGLPSPNAISATSAEVRRRLSSDSVVVAATIIGGSATGPIAAIATVADYNRAQIFMLGERNGGLIFSLRMRTADVKVATPDIRLDSVFPMHRSRTPDTMMVAGGLIHHVLWISARHHGVTRERTQPIDAGLGWSYFVPFDYEYGPEAPWLTVLWIAGLSAPSMYWATRAGRKTVFSVGTVLAVTLLLIPLATGVHPTAWWEWVALALGACIGVALGKDGIRASPPT